jgi:magnesium-transporting ATPase (P-type)
MDGDALAAGGPAPAGVDAVRVSHHGLSSHDVDDLRRKHGYNEIVEAKTSPVLQFIKTFYGPVPFMLMFTIVITGLLHKWESLGMVTALLLANSIIGTWESLRAASAVDALMERLVVEAKVKRDGAWKVLPARELVPGDVIRIRAGDFVPADALVTEGHVTADESALTGESEPREIPGEKGSEVSSGGQVVRGEVTCIVLRTGAQTVFGKTVQLVAKSKPQMHAQVVTGRVAFILLVATLVVAASVVVVVAAQHQSMLEALPNIVMIVVSGLPSALPAMFSLTMAFGSQELTQHGVLITSLEATEDSARMTVLCADKTGTITENRLSYAGCRHVPDLPRGEAAVLFAGTLASAEANADAIDLAIIGAARASGDRELARQLFPGGTAAAPGAAAGTAEGEAGSSSGTQAHGEWRVESFRPFDPATRRTEAVVVHVGSGRRLRVVKGAVKEILSLCDAPVYPTEDPAAGAIAAPVGGFDAVAAAAGVGDATAGSTGAAGPVRSRNGASLNGSPSSSPSASPAAAASPALSATASVAAALELPQRRLRNREDVREWLEAAELAFSAAGCRAIAIAASELAPLRVEQPVAQHPAPGGASGPTAASSAAAVVPASADAGSDLISKHGSGPLSAAAAHGGGLQLLGVVGLRDPPRTDTARSLAELRRLGVRTVMITGDTGRIARVIAKEVGLGEQFVSLQELQRQREASGSHEAGAARGSQGHASQQGTVVVNMLHAGTHTHARNTAAGNAGGSHASDVHHPHDQHQHHQRALSAAKGKQAAEAAAYDGDASLAHDTALLSAVARADGFAEVFPHQKHLLVRALQEQGVVVGMTGDGINDAPALSQAEVGVAVSNATDVAKKAARAVLVNDGLSGIIDLVRVSRTIHQRIETWVLNKTAKEFIMAFFIVILYFATGTWVVGAFELGLLLLLIDFVTLSIAADNAPGSDKPQQWEVRAVCGGAGVRALLREMQVPGTGWIAVAWPNLWARKLARHSLRRSFPPIHLHL